MSDVPTFIEKNDEKLKQKSGQWFRIKIEDPRDRILIEKTLESDDISFQYMVNGDIGYDAKIEEEKIYFKYQPKKD